MASCGSDIFLDKINGFDRSFAKRTIISIMHCKRVHYNLPGCMRESTNNEQRRQEEAEA